VFNSNFVRILHRFRDMATSWSKIAENLTYYQSTRSLGVTP